MKNKTKFLLLLIATTIMACKSESSKFPDVPHYAKSELIKGDGFEYENFPAFFDKHESNEKVIVESDGGFFLERNVKYHGKRGSDSTFDKHGQAYSSRIVTCPASGDDESEDYRFHLVYSGGGLTDSDVSNKTFHFKITEPKPEETLIFLRSSDLKNYCNSWMSVDTQELNEASQWLNQLQKSEPETSLFADEANDQYHAVRSKIGKSVMWEGAIDGQPHDFRSIYLECGKVVNIINRYKTSDIDGRKQRKHNIWMSNIFDGKTFDGLFDKDNDAVNKMFIIE